MSDPVGSQERDRKRLTDTWKPANGVYPPAMFFKWSAEVERVEE